MFKKHDSEKPRFDLAPPLAQLEYVKVLTFGAQKYAPDNWRDVDDLARYVAAALRHVNAYQRGEQRDPETGLHHLAHAMCCCAFIIEKEMEK